MKENLGSDVLLEIVASKKKILNEIFLFIHSLKKYDLKDYEEFSAVCSLSITLIDSLFRSLKSAIDESERQDFIDDFKHKIIDVLSKKEDDV